MAYLGQPEQEDDVYGGDIPEEVHMEADFDSTDDAEAAAAAESKAKEIEQEAGALREMQAKVESQIGVAQEDSGASATQAEKEEVDSRSIYVGNEDPDDRAWTAGAVNIYIRDYSAPTGDDKMDRSMLPKVMQVKHFGQSGRTKWIHLVNEDTTDWNSPWTYNDPLRAKYDQKMAGMNTPIEKPKGS